MTIIYLHQYFTLPTLPGGTRSYDLAKQFVNGGHKVVVITSSAYLTNHQYFQKGWTVLNYEGIELHVLQLEYSNKLSFTKRIISFCKFFVQASFRIMRVKGDIVLATSTPLTIAIPALIKKAIQNTPFIFEVRDVWPEIPIAMGFIKNKFIQKILLRFEKFIYLKAHHIVALSEDMKNSIFTRTFTPEEKLSVIHNISEIERFSFFESNNNYFSRKLGFKPEKTVLYAGALGMVNGLKYMIDLAANTKKIDSSIKFIIFGDGMEKEDLLAYAKEKGVMNNNLYFFKPVPKSILPQLYHECTIAASFVISVPELWANSANKFFDALAAGKPIVINHRGWQADIIETKNIGFVLDFDNCNIKQEAKIFCNYLNNRELLKIQGENAKRLAEKNYSLKIASNKYLKILNNVVPQLHKSLA